MTVQTADTALPGASAWDEARRAWQLHVDQRPAAVVFPESAQDVADAIGFARERGLRVAAQGTGHNAAPLGALEDTLLLKTERMRGVTIDAGARMARVAAGVRSLEAVQAAAAHDLALRAGTSPDLGVVGYTIGGGIGLRSRRYGLAANHVHAIELVTADGKRERKTMSAVKDPADHEYILGADDSERSRLLTQSEIHRAQSERLLERFGVRSGGRVIDIGCGPLGVLDVLSTIVGRNGRAIGLDNEPRMIAHARQTIAERDLTNVELILADGADTGVEADSLDLAHERLVLINHPAPQDIVGEMTRIVRPGGWVMIEEVDTLSWTCEPAHPAWTELLEAFNGAWRAADQDPFIGRRLPALLRGAGLTDVGFDVDVLVWQPGHPYQTLLLTFISMFRDRIVRGGLIDARRLDRLVAQAELHLAKPDTYVIHPLFFQAWGRKPANPPADLTHEIDREPPAWALHPPHLEVTAIDRGPQPSFRRTRERHPTNIRDKEGNS